LTFAFPRTPIYDWQLCGQNSVIVKVMSLFLFSLQLAPLSEPWLWRKSAPKTLVYLNDMTRIFSWYDCTGISSCESIWNLTTKTTCFKKKTALFWVITLRV